MIPEDDVFGPIRLPVYRLFLISLGATTLASQIQATAVSYQLYAVTRDPLSLGLIGLAEALPFIAFSLLGGHAADVRNRRQVVVASLMVTLGCSGALWILTRGVSHFSLGGFKWAIYGIIALSGVARSFLGPARQALSADLLPRNLYVRAVSWRSGIWQMTAVAGPALGGALYGWAGPAWAYGAVSFLLLVSIIAFLRVETLGEGRSTPDRTVWAGLQEAFAFLWSEPLILPAMTLDLFAVLFGGAVALLPIFAEEILRVGPKGYGILRAAPAVGAVAVSILLVALPPLTRVGKTLLMAVAMFGLCTIGFGLSRSFALSVFLLALSGGVDMVSVVVRSTLIQLRVPREMLGRITSINQIFIGSSNEIGAFESGVTARLLGTVPSVILGGAMTLLVAGATAWRAPVLRDLKTMEEV